MFPIAGADGSRAGFVAGGHNPLSGPSAPSVQTTPNDERWSDQRVCVPPCVSSCSATVYSVKEVTREDLSRRAKMRTQRLGAHHLQGRS